MIVARVVFPSPGGPYSSTWSSASPRERAASIATAKFSLTLGCPINSSSRCGRSLSSNDESSSTGAAETSRCFRSGVLFRVATGGIVSRNQESGNAGERTKKKNADFLLGFALETGQTLPISPETASIHFVKSTFRDATE